MAATVVNAPTASPWTGHKPAGYKAQDLEKALKTYEPLASQSLAMPTKAPSAPKATVSDMDAYLTSM